MQRVDIERMYRFLAEYQELDPEVAKRLLQRILEVLQMMKRMRMDRHQSNREESVDEQL